MDWKNNIIDNFLQSMDVNARNIDNNYITLVFESGAEINIDLQETGALLTIVQAINSEQEDYIYEKVLLLANYKNNFNNFIQVSIPEDDKLAISLFLPDESFNHQNIEKGIEYINSVFEAIE